MEKQYRIQMRKVDDWIYTNQQTIKYVPQHLVRKKFLFFPEKYVWEDYLSYAGGAHTSREWYAFDTLEEAQNYLKKQIEYEQAPDVVIFDFPCRVIKKA